MTLVIGAIGQLLPIGLAAAISSVPITAMIVILLSPQRKAAALPFLIGSVVGLLVVVVLATFAAQVLPEGRPRQPQVAAGIVEMVAGIGLAVLGVITWRHRDRGPHGGEVPAVPGWAAALDTISPFRAFGLGVILDLRPKSLLLASVVGVHIHLGSLDPGQALAAVAIYVVIATSTVTVPIVATIVAPTRMEPRLRSAEGVLAAQGAIISSVVLIMIGAVVIGAALEIL
jgi:hypothetical protein